MIRRRPIRTDGWPRRLVPVVIGVLPVHGRLLAAIDPPVRSLGQVEGTLATAWPGRGRFSPDTVHVTVGLADGQRINVEMTWLLAARVREGEAVTVRKSRTLPGRVAYADAIPSRYTLGCGRQGRRCRRTRPRAG